jgi:sphingolipid 4-desaturase/C4-monooxygenase
MFVSNDNFVVAQGPEPHRIRTREILQSHPEVKKLIGKTSSTFYITLFCVISQITIAYFLRNEAWYIIGAVAWCVGAFFSHTLFVCIHEAAHNLVFRKVWANVATAIIANFPSIAPTAVTFKNFHIKHHAFQGVHEIDADIPDWYEARLIKNYSIGKVIWLFFYPLFQAIRTLRCYELAVIDKFVMANIVCQIAFDVAIVYFLGWGGLGYLFFSFWFSVGLHPLGARWIQEHYLVMDLTQETYSYYGRLNTVNMNVGYHNEHHDMPSIPWTNLPKLKAIAPEFYEPLYSHKSFTKLFVRFIFDQELSLFSRIIRKERGKVSLKDQSTPDTDLINSESLSPNVVSL